MMMMPSILGENLFDNWMDEFPFGNFLKGDKNSFFGKSDNNLMKTDVEEKDNSYQVTMDLPGYNKEDVNAKLKDGYLTISAKRENDNDEKDQEGNYIRRERFFGQCSRTFYVGSSVKQEDIKAKFENGILTLNFPKEAIKRLEENENIAIEG